MKKSLSFLTILLPMLLLWGCQSVQSRIERHPEWYAQLNQKEQAAIEESRLELGLSQEAVYFILGWPDEKRSVTREGETLETWVYTRIRENWEGSQMAGYSRRSYIAVNPETGKRHLVRYYVPNYVDVYSVDKEVVAEIEFKDNKVSSISETLPNK